MIVYNYPILESHRITFTMRQFFKSSVVILWSVLWITACTEQLPQEAQTGLNDPSLGLETYTIDQLKGQTVIDEHTLDYNVVNEAGRYYMEVLLDNHRLEAWISYAPEVVTHDGHSAVLTLEQKALLLSFSDQLGEAIVTSNGNTPTNFEMGLMEYAFVRTLEFWSQAPNGFVHDRRTNRADIIMKGTGNDGVSCIRKGREYRLSYTNRNNRTITKTRKANYNGGGSYNCMGRCGAACGRWWIASSWTLDCFEHDQCSLDNNASGGGSDPNCGDEWWNASDDWVFGVSRGCFGR